MYTTENTLNDIFRDDVVKAHFEYMMPLEFVEMVPEDLWDAPLKNVKDKVQMPWGVPYISEEMVAIANQIHEVIESDAFTFVQLWSTETPAGFFPNTDGEKMHLGLLKLNDSLKAGRKMALVVPGGAYINVAISNEGIDTARRLMEAGYAVVVMNYRCAPNRYPVPQMDLALAIKYMRSMADEYDLQDDLLVLGYSAGGHLVASEAAYYNEIEKVLIDELKKENEELLSRLGRFSARPDKVALAYPVISFVSEQHEDSFINLTGGDETLRDKLSIELHVTADYPKTFVWACDDDIVVPPSNAARMYEALKKSGVDVCHKTYPTGGHGCATGVGTSADGWINEMADFMQQ
jgi:acetyl esterase/lipase